MIRLSRLLQESASAGMRLQRSDGSFPPGHNGPWNEPETPVRTTANWAVLLLHAGNDRQLQAAERALGYLAVSRAPRRPYLCRAGKDPPNGLIGQAWALDALLEGSERLGDAKYLQAAEELILMHPFHEGRGLWHNLTSDGGAGSVNNTLNQQVWFGAAALKAARMGGDRTIGSRARRFFGKLHEQVRSDGRRIAHHINRVTEFLMPGQSEGYLSFLLFGLAKACREDEGVIDERVRRLLQPCMHHLDASVFDGSPRYAWSYNPTGFEAAHAIEAFGLESRKGAQGWISEQLRRSYDFGSRALSRGTDDPMTLSSRISEACGLRDYRIKIEEKIHSSEA